VRRLVVAIVSSMALCGSGRAAAGTDACSRNRALYDQAMALYSQKQFAEALETAAKVQKDPGCEFVYVQAKGLESRVWTFELRDFEKGIAASRQGLDADPRQTTLWFTLGYAQYELDLNDDALQSFQQALDHAAAVPVPEETLIQTRYLIADAADRRAVHQRSAGPGPAAAEGLGKAVEAWKGFLDFCRSAPCSEEKLHRAEQRIRQLESTASR
jgi:tetratricopeptide (TPR) repeat protein